MPDLPAIFPEVVGGIQPRTGFVHSPVEYVRVVIDAARHEPLPVIESMIVRTGFLFQSEVPLTGHVGLVSEWFQCGSNRWDVRWQSSGSMVTHQNGSDTRIARVSAGQERGSSRTAHRTVRLPAGETSPSLGETIDVRCLDVRGTHAGEITVALIVSEEDDEVRFFHTISDPVQKINRPYSAVPVLQTTDRTRPGFRVSRGRRAV